MTVVSDEELASLSASVRRLMLSMAARFTSPDVRVSELERVMRTGIQPHRARARARGIYLNCGQVRPDRFFGIYRVPLPTLPSGP